MAISIQQLAILRSGEKSLIERTVSTKLARHRDSWVVDLRAPDSAFLRALVEGQLVLLHWEYDSERWEAYARARAIRPDACPATTVVHWRFEGTEAKRPRETPDTPIQGACLAL